MYTVCQVNLNVCIDMTQYILSTVLCTIYVKLISMCVLHETVGSQYSYVYTVCQVNLNVCIDMTQYSLSTVLCTLYVKLISMCVLI